MKVNYDEVMRYLEYRTTVNKVDLAEIEWIRDDGSKLEFDPKISEDWKFMGMTNVCFAEMYLSRVAAGEQKELLAEIETWYTDDEYKENCSEL